MVNKTTKQGGMKGKKGKIKVLNLKKETVKKLRDDDAKDVKGGARLLEGYKLTVKGSYPVSG